MMWMPPFENSWTKRDSELERIICEARSDAVWYERSEDGRLIETIWPLTVYL
jgi:hypothetical protein